LNNSYYATKVGVYVDLANISLNGGYGLRFDVLRRFACRDNGQAIRLNVYLAFDEDRAKADPEYCTSALNYHSLLRDWGYKVIEKRVRWYQDDRGNRVGKSNADLELAVDALLQSENLDRVLLVTGDGDFVQVVRALQNKGCRVEVVAFENVSMELRKEADLFMSGYLIPTLLPFQDKPDNRWGKLGHRVRGVCYKFNREKGFGFTRFMKDITADLWVTDTRREESPFETAFVHLSQFADPKIRADELPNRHTILEFDIEEGEKGFQAVNVWHTYSYHPTYPQALHRGFTNADTRNPGAPNRWPTKDTAWDSGSGQ
jgi:uncharacterized LabA/DUF88 family protein/cold shock CspA family protein